MALRLKSRELQIPNGFVFYQPETGWKPPRFQSFMQLVQQIIRHRQANPALAAQHGWNLSPQSVEVELEEFNARICVSMGWDDYVMHTDPGGGLPPKSTAPTQADQKQVSAAAGRAKKIWSGVKTLNDWIDSGDPAVPPELSLARAAICAKCQKNTPGDFTTWFTKPAAGAIQRQLEKVQDRNLSTPSDAVLNVCDVCLCPLKLKVHTPL
jgi:hypothetical protein